MVEAQSTALGSFCPTVDYMKFQPNLQNQSKSGADFGVLTLNRT